MSRRVEIDPAAQSDLDAIYDYLASRNPAAADRYIREITDRCYFYADSPLIGQEEPDVARFLGEPTENVRSFLYRHHRCFYVIGDEQIRALRFLDMRQNPDVPLEERFSA